ncbi:uncharacterized protein [Watersipora subatra]|uniref:uncharacterized protein n=1 Tax=Watersipora subatra TaxID=2589382 RepID=UPI00355C3805
MWKWKVLSFGLTSAPATFQRFMERVLLDFHWRTLLLYRDDIIVIAPDFNTHRHRLEEVFQRLHLTELKLKPFKYELLQPQVRYLGHIVSKDGVSTDLKKVKAVTEWPNPLGIKEVQMFLGTVGYYRQHILEFSTIANPLHRLTAKGKYWKWMEEEQIAFNKLKSCISTAPVLGYPDLRRQYILDTDASKYRVKAMLSQVQEVARWLEILAEFRYTLKHRSGTRHENPEGLSRQTCKDCRQCASIEQRDGRPSWKELAREQEPLAAVQTGSSHRTLTPTVARLNLNGGGNPEGLPTKPGKSGPKEHLEVGSRELDILHHMQGSLRIQQDGVLEARVALQGCARRCAICPPAKQETLAHSVVGRATSRFQLTWYWPGLMFTVRRLIKSCKVCQAAKHRGTKAARGKRRLYARRLWQKVAMDLVVPFLVTLRGYKWVLSERKLKLYHACPEKVRQALATLEQRRGPNMKGARHNKPKKKLEDARDSPLPAMLPSS